MKFLADAHVSVEMVAMIRDLGHDCLDASAIPTRMLDIDVLQMAADDGEEMSERTLRFFKVKRADGWKKCLSSA